MNRFTHVCPARLGSQLRFLVTRRSLRLTSDGTRFLLFTIGIGVAAVNTGNNLFYMLVAMMLSIVVISGLLSEQCRHSARHCFPIPSWPPPEDD